MEEEIFYANTEVKAGNYKCVACTYVFEAEDGDVLPICPICGFDQYILVED